MTLIPPWYRNKFYCKQNSKSYFGILSTTCEVIFRQILKMRFTLTLLLLCVFIKTDDSTDTALFSDQQVFENDTARFKICNTGSGHFTVNEVPLSQHNSTLKDDAVVINENSCHSLMFKALMEYDNYKIGFRAFRSTEDIDTAILHVQGVLQAPENFHWQEKNSTHITIVWDPPFSWLGHHNTTYELVFMQENDEIKRVTILALNYTILRPSVHIIVHLTPVNPVGKGDSSLLDLTDSLAYCGSTSEDEIIGHGYIQPYMEAEYINIRVPIKIYSDRKYCLGMSDQVKIIHGMLPPNTIYSLTVKDDVIFITLHHLPPNKHLMNVTIIPTGIKEFNISFSTYQVQVVNVTDDYRRLQCQFLHGTSHDSCFVDIYDGNKTTNTFSGANIYQLDITTPGTYTLKVYDDIQQRDLGIEPAEVIVFNVENRNEHSLDSGPIIGGVLSVLIVLMVVSILLSSTLVWWKCFKTKPEPAEIHSPEDDEAEHESAMITGKTITEDDEEHESAMITGKTITDDDEEHKSAMITGNTIITDDRPHRRSYTPIPAVQRNTEDMVDAQVHIDIDNVTATFTNGDSKNVKEDEDKEDEVVEGLPTIELHQPAIIQVQ